MARLSTGKTVVVAEEEEYYDWSTGFGTSRVHLRFEDANGTPLLEDIGDGGALKLTPREYRDRDGTGTSLRVCFQSHPDERLVGMGMYQQEMLDLKGSTLELAHRNSQSSVPFVLSSRGYGFLWNLPAVGRVVFGTNRTEWHAELARQVDYWVVAGDTPLEIADAYAEATGRAPMMPEYGLGFWQSRLRYWNQDQLLEVAREYRRREIPLDVIVADFFHWPEMGDWRFEDEFWPDPTAMVDELRDLGVELMVSVWPQVSAGSENFARLRDENLLVTTRRGIDVQYFFDGRYTRFLDVTEPRARAFLRERLTHNYGRHGIRLFWLDEAEPEYGVYDFDHYRYAAGPGAEVTNLYPRDFVRAIAEEPIQSGQAPEVSLVRAAWAGSQRYGALVWSGDIHSTFADLRAQIAAGIHMGAAGIPWFTTDIGGFAGGDPEDPAFRELVVRWFQLGAFSPVMRLHGDRRPSTPVHTAGGERRLNTGSGNEVWSFGPEVEPILVSCIALREDLRAYTRTAMRAAHESGAPVMRGMFFEFPDDPATWTIGDQFLFGPEILVAPVTHAGARARSVYLPAGASWTEASTGTTFEGGQTVEAAAPLDVVPVFARTAHALALLDRLRRRA
ncbi:TIM-barrel domain-containing protein [Terrabacter sp. GCM10028922]|uniref:glycoside hydrolase family 31 protein n=1 Tax=Terrabacter sp. GCM10028922 TaxID=3273428 RepID=UPI00361C5393